MRRSNVCTNVILVAFLSIFLLGCSKYDKIDIMGTWVIDIKAAKGLPAEYEYARETVIFNSDKSYTQKYEESRGVTKKETWTITGSIERKKDQMTFKNRIKDGTNPQRDETFPYTVKGDKLTLEDESFPNKEKIYTKVPAGGGSQ